MYGISSSGKEAIEIAISKMFDSLAYKLLGNIPKLREKSPFFSSSPKFSLAHIFIQAMNNKEPNYFERDVLKGILNSSYGYIEGLKNRTSSNVVESVDALVREAKVKGETLNSAQVAEAISAGMEKAKSDMKLIAEAETTKTRNMGHTMEILENTKKLGIEDPTCFFIIVRDNKTCMEENELVVTTKGPVAIGQIRVGDILKNPSTPSQKGGNRVISVEKQQKETIELDFGDKRIICTKDHPILVRFGKILCFIEANRITEDHDVVLAHEIRNKGDLKMITRAITPRKFMKNLGYSDAWDFWRENVDDMISIAKVTESRIPIMKKYGIDVSNWDQYVVHILKGYDKTIRFVGRSPNNNFNTEQSRNKSVTIKMLIQEEYFKLGGDNWFIREIKKGKNSKTLSKETNLPLNFLSSKIKPLGLLSEVRSRGGRANWKKNRDILTQLHKDRGTLHFQPISKPEMMLGKSLSGIFSDLRPNFGISKMKVDFCIPSLRIVIEYDGSGHNLRDRLIGNKTNKITNQTDFARDRLLRELGFRVFRIKAPKDKFEIKSIISSIQDFISSEKEFGIWQD